MKSELFRRCQDGHYNQSTGNKCPQGKVGESREIKIKKVFKMMIDSEKNQDQAREYLIDTCCLDVESADRLISEISNCCERYEKADTSAFLNIALGILCFIVGSMVTAISYSDGGKFVIAGGAIIGGLALFIVGWISKSKAIRQRNKLILENLRSFIQ